MNTMAKNKVNVSHKASRFKITGRLHCKQGPVVRVDERRGREHLRSGLEELVQRIHPLNELGRDADQEELL